jgi:hypothetical protein
MFTSFLATMIFVARTDISWFNSQSSLGKAPHAQSHIF